MDSGSVVDEESYISSFLGSIDEGVKHRAIAHKKIRPSHIEHRTPNVEQGILPIYKLAERSESIVRRSMLNVRCSMFNRHIQVSGENIHCAQVACDCPGVKL
jgi:hypothetical protein